MFCNRSLESLRPLLHRWRRVKMGDNVWVGYDAVIETSHPQLVTLGNNVTISGRAMIIAHFLLMKPKKIETFRAEVVPLE